MATTRTNLSLESLDERRVPATLNLGSAGAQGFLNGAHFAQLSPGAVTDPTHTFLRLQESSILGSFLTPEEGYNTSARPLQFDATNSGTRSLLLSEVPVVTFNGNQYREFLLTVNQPFWSSNIDLTELRVFASGNGNLSGYNTTTDTLAGLLPVFNLDGAGNHTVRMNDNLNRTSSADVRVLIPASAFGSADPDSTYVYLYSKFTSLVGTSILSGAESWAVREVTPPPPPDGPGALSGRVFRDANENGVYDEGEGIGGITVTLSGVDGNGENLFPDGDPVFITNSDGSYSFDDLGPGEYFVVLTEQSPYVADTALVGTTTDPDTYEGDAGSNGFFGILLTEGETGENYDFRMVFENS